MRMKNSTTFLLGVFCMAILAVSCNNAPKTTEEAEAAHMLTGDELVKRGEYLVTSMGCHDCHSQKTGNAWSGVDSGSDAVRFSG